MNQAIMHDFYIRVWYILENFLFMPVTSKLNLLFGNNMLFNPNLSTGLL